VPTRAIGRKCGRDENTVKRDALLYGRYTARGRDGMARSGRVEGLSTSLNANDVPGNRLYRHIVLYRKLTNYSYSALHDFRRICLVASGGLHPVGATPISTDKSACVY
jgi:hypothetical protein